MTRQGFIRIPLRRETLATRKLRARIARERQGPDGKWETNQKKREVRSVKRKCKKLNHVFAEVRSKRLTDEIAAINEAKQLLAELTRIAKPKALKDLMPRLEMLAVSPALLRQSPSVLDALTTAAKTCRKSKDDDILRLVSKWQTIKSEGKTRYRLSRKRAPPVEDVSAGLDPCQLVATVSEIAQPRYVTPCRPLKSRPTVKLGKLFADMRAKHAAKESEAVEIANKLTIDLAKCRNASTLRCLIPQLEALLVTPRVLKESPSILQELEAAGKRCRKSKDESVSRLLSNWREKQREIVHEYSKDRDTNQDDVSALVSDTVASSEAMVAQAPTTRGQDLKQCTIKAFLGNAVTTAGG
mmetsp:Transcript_83027/g.130598  ORF Transcript_83027/g.130598 Transcript_83027/m.130598 type:complete len:356 (-) Transcript_83027:105-1172(-)